MNSLLNSPSKTLQAGEASHFEKLIDSLTSPEAQYVLWLHERNVANKKILNTKWRSWLHDLLFIPSLVCGFISLEIPSPLWRPVLRFQAQTDLQRIEWLKKLPNKDGRRAENVYEYIAQQVRAHMIHCSLYDNSVEESDVIEKQLLELVRAKVV